MNLTDKTGEAVTSIEKVTVASVDTEEADAELAEEFMEGMEDHTIIPEEDNEEGGAE